MMIKLEPYSTLCMEDIKIGKPRRIVSVCECIGCGATERTLKKIEKRQIHMRFLFKAHTENKRYDLIKESYYERTN